MDYTLLDTDNYFDQAEAVYTFCVLNHEGQNSVKYSVLSARLDFKPGHFWSESQVEQENDFYSEVSSWSDDELETFCNELDHYFENRDD
jgi:hypothetical protein